MVCEKALRLLVSDPTNKAIENRQKAKRFGFVMNSLDPQRWALMQTKVLSTPSLFAKGIAKTLALMTHAGQARLS